MPVRSLIAKRNDESRIVRIDGLGRLIHPDREDPPQRLGGVRPVRLVELEPVASRKDRGACGDLEDRLKTNAQVTERAAFRPLR